jgi:hypothetical protein
MQKRLRHLVWIVLILTVLFLAWPRAARFLAVDRCLDNGGRWDDASDSCEYARPAQ